MPIVSTQFVNSTERVGVVTGGVPADAALQPAIASITAHPNDINNGAIVLLPLFITEVPSFPSNPLHLTGNQLESAKASSDRSSAGVLVQGNGKA